MKRHDGSLKRNPFCLILLSFALALLMGLACQAGGPRGTRAPASFPDTDLVHATNRGVGFVNADGSEWVDLDFSVQVPGAIAGSEPAAIARPVITEDSNVLVAKVSTYMNYWYITNNNLLVIWRRGEAPVFCSQWGLQASPLLTQDQSQILVDTDTGIAHYELDSCGTDERPASVDEGLFGALSPNSQYVAYRSSAVGFLGEHSLTIRNLKNGDERTIQQADFPVWSRNSQWLAYTGADGIYVVDASRNRDPIRVVADRNPSGDIDPLYSSVNQLPPPEAAWSPDGEWLVYHRLTAQDYSSDLPNYYSIFKANVKTGEEYKIIDGGLYPYWRWPAERP